MADSLAIARSRPRKPKPALNPRHQAFVREYLISFNATQAAIKAGYKKTRAAVTGHELVRKSKIQAEIEKGKAIAAAKLELKASDNLEQIRRGSQFDMRGLFDSKGNLRPIKELTAEEAAAIAGFEVVHRNLTSGDGQTDTIIKVKLIDRAKYVDMAGRFHGQFSDKVEVDLGEQTVRRLLAGRKRVGKE